MTKISIARRRLELQTRAPSYPSGTGIPPTGPLILVGNTVLAEEEASPGSRTLAFPIPEVDAHMIESLARENEHGRKELTATLQREGTILVMRIQPLSVTKKLISCEVVSEMLGMSRSYVYHLAHEGKIPTYRIGRTLRFDPLDVFDFMANCLEGSGKPSCT